MSKNKRAKQKSKNRRKQLKNRLQNEKILSEMNKAEKAERNRRFSGQKPQIELPEDSCFYFDTTLLFDEDNEKELDILETLYNRQFFYRLSQLLEKNECDNEFTMSIKLLQDMGYGKERIDETLNLFRNQGGYCDCEIILNILGKCLKTYFNFDSYDIYNMDSNFYD